MFKHSKWVIINIKKHSLLNSVPWSNNPVTNEKAAVAPRLFVFVDPGLDMGE